MSATTTQAPSAARRMAIARPMPDPAPVTSATRAASGLGLGMPRELRLLERPVLDPELLRLRDRRVGRQGLGAAHDVDGVDVELAGDAGRLLVGAEPEHADPGHEHDRRVGAAHRRAVGRRVALVVGPIVVAIGGVQLAQPGDDVGQLGRRRQVEDHRADLRPQEVVGAGRPQRGQPRVLGAGQEIEDDRVVGVVADLRPIGRGEAADERQQRGGPLRGARPRGAARSPGSPARTAPGGRARRCTARRPG